MDRPSKQYARGISQAHSVLQSPAVFVTPNRGKVLHAMISCSRAIGSRQGLWLSSTKCRRGPSSVRHNVDTTTSAPSISTSAISNCLARIHPATGLACTVTVSTTIFSFVGLFFLSTSISSSLSRTPSSSAPSMTRPKTVFLPSRCAASLKSMKN